MFREIILLSGFLVLISAYPTIKPYVHPTPDSVMCRALLPNATVHSHQPQSSTTNPYHIFASSQTYLPGDIIEIKISGDTLIGALIQALDVTTNRPIGEWQLQSVSYISGCNAVLYASFNATPTLDISWKAPETNGNVYFKGLVMKSFDTFWSGIVSELAV